MGAIYVLVDGCVGNALSGKERESGKNGIHLHANIHVIVSISKTSDDELNGNVKLNEMRTRKPHNTASICKGWKKKQQRSCIIFKAWLNHPFNSKHD